MEINQIDWKVIAIIIPCLVIYGIAAMHYGINGKMFAIVVGIIGFALGIPVPNPFQRAKA